MGYDILGVVTVNNPVHVAQIAHRSITMFRVCKIIDNANTQCRKKTVLYQATTNETQHSGGCRFRCVPFFEKISNSFSSFSYLWDTLNVPFRNPLGIQGSQFP